MQTMIRKISVLLLGVVLPALCAAPASGADDWRYKYVLELGTDQPVCTHMLKVYNNTSFRQLWMRPALERTADSPYGPNGEYAFQKREGVGHDYGMTFQMGYSKLPRSREFDEIQWKEGRYRFAPNSGMDRDELPFLVADVDINNDGHVDRVFKIAFMSNYWPSGGSVAGGEDVLAVFLGGTAIPKDITSKFFYGGSAGHRAEIIQGVYHSRLLRLFSYRGATYLSAYEQKWKGGEYTGEQRAPSAELMRVLRYGEGNELEAEEVCRFRMTTKP